MHFVDFSKVNHTGRLRPRTWYSFLFWWITAFKKNQNIVGWQVRREDPLKVQYIFAQEKQRFGGFILDSSWWKANLKHGSQRYLCSALRRPKSWKNRILSWVSWGSPLMPFPEGASLHSQGKQQLGEAFWMFGCHKFTHECQVSQHPWNGAGKVRMRYRRLWRPQGVHYAHNTDMHIDMIWYIAYPMIGDDGSWWHGSKCLAAFTFF